MKLYEYTHSDYVYVRACVYTHTQMCIQTHIHTGVNPTHRANRPQLLWPPPSLAHPSPPTVARATRVKRARGWTARATRTGRSPYKYKTILFDLLLT